MSAQRYRMCVFGATPMHGSKDFDSLDACLAEVRKQLDPRLNPTGEMATELTIEPINEDDELEYAAYLERKEAWDRS